MFHRYTILIPAGRLRLRLARCVVEYDWPLRRAAERFQVSVSAEISSKLDPVKDNHATVRQRHDARRAIEP